MLRNFFKITFRNFRKNKSYVVINLLGLGLSLACCIVGYLNWKYSAGFDQNHENHARIYKIHTNKNVQGENFPYGIAPLPLGDQIKGKYPDVSHTSRYANDGYVLKHELKVFNQQIGFAEDDFFEMFTFPFKYGSKEALQNRSSIILRASIAETYFGEGDPTGKTIYLITEKDEEIPMTVGAVIEDIPTNSSIRFSGITHFDNMLKLREVDNQKWDRFIAGTFIMTKGDEFPQALLDDINTNYIDIQNKANSNFKVASYQLERLTTLKNVVRFIRSNWLSSPPPAPAVNVPVIMAGLLLLIACFNFTNTSIAISSKRLKEIGIRKVMGSRRNQLIFQFLGENLVLSAGALLLGLVIASLLTPVYSAMWDFINLELDLTQNAEIYLFLIGLLIFTSLVAGGYPSLYISGYQPVKILRGSLSLGGANVFSKALLGFQFLFTALALIAALAFSNNASYQSKLDIGFDQENIIAVRIQKQSDYEKYKNMVAQLPEVDDAVGTTHHIGWWTYSSTLRNGEIEHDAFMMNISLEYQDMMNLKILEGRYFDRELYEHERQNSIIVNEQLANEFGWEKPVGQVLQIDDTTRLQVVGVMKDFYMYGFFNKVSPTAFRLADKKKMNFLIAKGSGNPKDMYKKLESKWYEVAPNQPFNADYQDEMLKQTRLVNENIMVMFRFLGLLAMVLSCIGLYTLVSLNVIKRIKEIGVRKVLGASIKQIIVMVSRQFFWLLLLSAMLGAALSYFAVDGLMASIFSIYKASSVLTVLLPFLFLILVSLSVASFRIFLTAVQNPIKSLRYE